jgi:acyl-CoA:acyl-CoA alkyltransferase
VEQLTGIQARRVADEGVYCSDLAALAARQVLRETGTNPADVDLLIFAAASLDLVEPATANLVQEKIGTRCPVFDVKNACNSFLNALEIAEALILTGAYRTILIAVGETPSRGIKWRVSDRSDYRQSFLGYTFGDAGAAALVVPSDDDRGILFRRFQTCSEHWQLATIPGGGSMHPFGDEYTYFRGDGARLRDAFLEVGAEFLSAALADSGTSLPDYRRFFIHQVSLGGVETFLQATGIPRDRVEITVDSLGNIAAATLPVGYARAVERGELRPGDLTLWIGMAAGISLGMAAIRV